MDSHLSVSRTILYLAILGFVFLSESNEIYTQPNKVRDYLSKHRVKRNNSESTLSFIKDLMEIVEDFSILAEPSSSTNDSTEEYIGSDEYYEDLQKHAGLGTIFSKTKPIVPYKMPDEVFSDYWFDEQPTTPQPESMPTKRGRAHVMRDTCQEIGDYELVTNAMNQYMAVVAVHPNTWVYTTRCSTVNTPCRGLTRFGINSACKQKKGWALAYVKSVEDDQPVGEYDWQWIAIDRACSCGISF
ncbi:uncharacterized protein LOC100379070 [Saccoglossus kowalevskii]|uniref:Uncharacterized protein LOC100379070 n=1 Tax=Saccoglossus kowalevskii TaxID=10224 RepID=A0ABM0GVX1_SACKO|nr:PREDICTED: uncharacterized protein LOC100379070 [Saccoglossus kowalevskii]